MTKRIQHMALAVLAAATLSACATATPALESHTDNFGKATANNKAAQFVAPTPAQKANTYIPADQSRRALAKDRYRKDEVEELTPVGTMN